MVADSKGKTMSSVDAAWLHMEIPSNLMMITGIFIFDRSLDCARLKTTLEQRFLSFDRFRQRVVEPRFGLGSPRWEIDPHFDINNHVHRIALPFPGDQETLQELVSDLMSTPLDFTKPLWQYHVVEGYGDGCALICRLHHCIGDGMALMQVLLSMTDDALEATWIPSEDQEGSRRRGSPLRLITGPVTAALGATRQLTGSLLSESWEMISNPGHALDRIRLGTNMTLALGRLLFLPPDPKTVFKGPLGVQKRAAWTRSMPLADIKAIGQATDSTVNDVLISAAAGALRRYLVGCGQEVEGLNCRAVVPVDLRQGQESQELGNRFGLFFLSLPVGMADSLLRLQELKHRMDQLKGTPEAVVAFAILYALGMTPTEIENIVVNIFGLKATAVMTNVPGPQQQLYLAGAPIRQIMFWVPQSGRLGLGLSIFSYNQQVLVGFATDAGLVPDPESLAAHFEAEVDALLSLVRQEAEEVARADLGLERAWPVTGGDDLARIKGIGPSFAARLRSSGVHTFAQLASSEVETLAAVVQAPDWRRPDYRSWIDQARSLAVVEL
jgi:WS/DGAT/MGAT family acyltransferase